MSISALLDQIQQSYPRLANQSGLLKTAAQLISPDRPDSHSDQAASDDQHTVEAHSVNNSTAEGSEPRQRKILHCDCDCFFAAIEMRDDPSLRGRPMAVGGSSDRRGVISTCNYEARAYGIHSAMPSSVAKRLCPDLLVVPHNFDKYREAAEQIRTIFYDYSELVEPLSLDEAFIDVTDTSKLHGSGTLIAEEIRQRVREKVNITISAGVAPNKFLAKIASDWNKPDGLFVIKPEQVDEFLVSLPVNKLFGVGKVTAEKMHSLGLYQCGDIRNMSVFELTEHFGSFGLRLHELSQGIDNRPVKVSRRRKSLSVEHTYSDDLKTLNVCMDKLPGLFAELNQRMDKLDSSYQVTKQFVKVKFNNFQSTTMEVGCQGSPRLSAFRWLFQDAIERGDGLPVRLLGIGVRFNESVNAGPQQLPLFVAQQS